MRSSLRRAAFGAAILAALCATQAPALRAQAAGDRGIAYEFSPAQSKISFTLKSTAHTVHGEFDLARGAVRIDPATGAASGEIVVDARSGRSGNDSRDANMREKVLETDKFSQIVFRPDRVSNFDASRGTFEATVHGTFSIHGMDHELSAPVQIAFSGGGWTATVKFSVPYVEWGMHDPSNFLLHAAKEVDVEIQFAGTAGQTSSDR